MSQNQDPRQLLSEVVQRHWRDSRILTWQYDQIGASANEQRWSCRCYINGTLIATSVGNYTVLAAAKRDAAARAIHALGPHYV